MTSGLENRLAIVEQQNKELIRALADLRDAIATARNQIQFAGAGGGGGSGGANIVYNCPSIPAIAGGASGTGDVYQMIGGTNTLQVTGATIYNVYASATTAGRHCTLGANGDGTYTVIAQSCT